MAYEGTYGGGHQRPYAGQTAQRPNRGGFGGGQAPQQQYGNYQGAQGYEDYGAGGFEQDYGNQHPGPEFRQAARPPPDHYAQGPRQGGRPAHGGYDRGGHMNGQAHSGGHHGGHHPPRGGRGPSPTRRGVPNGPRPQTGSGRPGPQDYPPNFDHGIARKPVHSAPVSPHDPVFGGGHYQDSPGQQWRHDMENDQQLVSQMSGMSMNGQRARGPPGVPGGGGSHSFEGSRHQGEYGRPSTQNGRAPHPGGRPPPPQDYPDSRRHPPGQAGGGYGEYDDGYSQSSQQPPRNTFAPPERSVTMPINSISQRPGMPPQRSETMPYNHGSAGQGIPQRPSTASGRRGSPPGGYSQDYQDYQGSEPDSFNRAGYGNQQQPAAFVDDVYDSYYDDPRMGNQDEGVQAHRRSLSIVPDFTSTSQAARGSFEQSMRPGSEHAHPGAHQTAKLSHARSLADMREPQAAIFEMAGDIPDVPAMPPMQKYPPDSSRGYNGSGGYNSAPPSRGPSVPPGAMGRPGYAGSPGASRPGMAAPPSTNPDGLPAHPAPVRQGLVSKSIINPHGKPPPIRNYGAVPRGGPPAQQYQQQQQPPVYQGGQGQGYQQQQPPPQQQQQQQQQLPQKQEQQAPQQQPVTPGELEHLRMVIKNDPSDSVSALRLAKRLIEASDVLIPNLPDPRARGKARERYLMDAQKVLKKLSSAQNQEAMFVLADGLGRGLFGNEPDSKEAFTLYQSAAKIGHAAAAYRTAVCCEIGHEEGGGTRKDPMKAIQWYKRSATLGDPPAMYKLGMILLKGLLGQPKNPREAVGWLKRAAERADSDNPHALHELGLLYESAQPNDVIIRDEQYALELYHQASELGYKFSQFRLGCVYEYGLLGCPIDPRLSIVWYSRAAQQEEHQAELALSGWYLTGSEGVLNQSDTEAYLWARKAAVAGLSKAEYAMGYFTEVGIGVPANLEDAKRWYWRAAAQDFPKARDRLEDLKRAGKGERPRQRERISRSRIEKEQEGECVVM